METTINQTYKQAIIFHQEGKFEEAERLYREILKTQPEHLDANNNLGIVLASRGKLKQAKEYYKKAIVLNPDFVFAYNNLGNVLKGLGELKEAEESYKKAIELKPNFTDTHYNLGITLQKQEKFTEAVKSYKNAIEQNPNFTKAHYNLGVTFQTQDKFKEAEESYKKAIEFKPDYVEALCNLAVIFQKQDKLKEAEESYKKAIEFKPDYAEAYNNLGNTLYKLGKFEEAEKSYKKAIEFKPVYAEAYNNLGMVLNNKGDLVASINSYKQTLNIQPDFAETWHSVFFPLQAIKLQALLTENHLPLLDRQVSNKYAQEAKSILDYRLNSGSPSTDKSLNDALSILSSADNTFIKNPKILITKLITKPAPPKKITAMVHFGRSGTGLLHSLIDGHPEVSTLPSVYFSEFFDHLTWKKIIAGGWEEMADRFTKIYTVLFDASSPVRIPTRSGQFIDSIGKKEGMTNVGQGKNEVLSVDKKKFIKDLKQLMDCHDRLDAFAFFKLIHSAYEKALNNHNEKELIFYHIHNPDTYAQLNFLRLAPNTNWLMMVREPVQSCESWISKSFHANDYNMIANKIFEMLFVVDQSIFQNKNSIGLRLEDLKKYPKRTIRALCDWLGIKENDCLYQMSAQGKKWWGDPTSPDFAKDEMTPFGKTSINRKLGSVFSKNDQFILSTLFYPFSVHFGYTQENLEKFKSDLLTIRPMLDQMFNFEKKIAQHEKIDIEMFMRSGPYLFLRSGMIERWNTLNKFHTYPNMLTPLKIN